jgi:hypothetical protein
MKHSFGMGFKLYINNGDECMSQVFESKVDTNGRYQIHNLGP